MNKILLILTVLSLNGCDNGKVCYYDFSKKQPYRFKLFIDKSNYNELKKDEEGNYIITVNEDSLYTSTSYNEISNTKSLFLLKGEIDYKTEEEIERIYNTKIIRNIVGDTVSTKDGFMIPVYFEIIFEKL